MTSLFKTALMIATAFTFSAYNHADAGGCGTGFCPPTYGYGAGYGNGYGVSGYGYRVKGDSIFFRGREYRVIDGELVLQKQATPVVETGTVAGTTVSTGAVVEGGATTEAVPPAGTPATTPAATPAAAAATPPVAATPAATAPPTAATPPATPATPPAAATAAVPPAAATGTPDGSDIPADLPQSGPGEAAPVATDAAASAVRPELQPLLGLWETETADANGNRSKVTLDLKNDGTATMTVNAGQVGPISLSRKFEVADGNFNLLDGGNKVALGSVVSANKDKVVLKRGENEITFLRP